VRTSAQRVVWGLVGALALVAAACRPDPASPRGAAERFLDAHYVSIDLDASLPLTTGLARAKVERERTLVAGFPADEATRKPQVWYRLLEERDDRADAVQFLYEGTVSPEGVERFQQRWLLTMREESGGWLVSNYEELPD